MHLSQHELCTRKMELALEVKFYLNYHWAARPWRRTLTNGSDIKYVFSWCRDCWVIWAVTRDWKKIDSGLLWFSTENWYEHDLLTFYKQVRFIYQRLACEEKITASSKSRRNSYIHRLNGAVPGGYWYIRHDKTWFQSFARRPMLDEWTVTTPHGCVSPMNVITTIHLTPTIL